MTEAEKSGSSWAWIGASIFMLILVTGFALVRWTAVGDYLSEEKLVELLKDIRQIWWAPLALIGLYALLAPLGVTNVPLIVAGAVFGPMLGTLYNTLGLLIGATTSFWLARGLGREFVMQMMGDRAKRVERLVDRHGFWPLVQTRFLPLPFAAVNFGAALTGVAPSQFVLASIVGLVPSTLIHSFFIANIMFVQGAERLFYLAGYGVAFVIFNLLIGVPWVREQRRRRKRYREIVDMRASRQRESSEA